MPLHADNEVCGSVDIDSKASMTPRCCVPPQSSWRELIDDLMMP